MTQTFHPDKRVFEGMTYRQYSELTRAECAKTDTHHLSAEEKESIELKRLNCHRMKRIDNSYTPGPEITNEINRIDSYRLWMVITENWCGDSAQNLPYIAGLAALNKNIDLRIILRDSNPDIMDHYLTNGTRSIPKLVAFDKDGIELFQWGARPAQAQELVSKLKQRGLEKKAYLEKLHSWYARSRGADIENEFLLLLKKGTFPKNSV
jgi:hypothetical protein